MTTATARIEPHVTFKIETERQYRRRRAVKVAALVATHAAAAIAAILLGIG